MFHFHLFSNFLEQSRTKLSTTNLMIIQMLNDVLPDQREQCATKTCGLWKVQYQQVSYLLVMFPN